MHRPPDPKAFEAANRRFHDFFDELRATFLERDDVLTQTALALLSREHVLMTGPPGTGKSALSASVIGRIPDKRTGRPSVFARQVTESTVHTDLVGPIDFKTLMASGRTEHFTDEGILGSVHAFLDEVLDGRDMLLRSTLNLLQERELKQGHRVTAGEIECAFMTTNRYLSDVLTQSRDTLLAFVDRVAFISFVPRGFADGESMRRVLSNMVSGRGLGTLRARLTVQDLDVLQHAATLVEVPTPLMGALSSFLADFDRSMQEARQADPTFIPTRYLSVRTGVRLGKLLRAIAVFETPRGGSMPLFAQREHLELLRTGLLLCGPRYEDLEALTEREPDPHERHQLETLRREREIFEACLSRVPKVAAPKPRKTTDLRKLTADLDEACGQSGPDALLAMLHPLTAATADGGDHTHEVQALLQLAIDELLRRAIMLAMHSPWEANEDLDVLSTPLQVIADQLEQGPHSLAAMATWLRTQLLGLVDRMVEAGPSPVGTGADSVPTQDLKALMAQAAQLPTRYIALRALRDRLLQAGAEAEDPDASAERWVRGGQQLVQQLAPVWDEVVRVELEAILTRAQDLGVSGIFGAMQPILDQVRRVADELDAHGAPGQALCRSVVNERIGPIVRLAIAHLQTDDRLQVAGQFDGLLDQLARVHLRAYIDTASLLQWTAQVLMRDEPPAESGPPCTTLEDYRALRRAEARVSSTYVLLDVAVRGADPDTTAHTKPAAMLDGAFAELGQLPPGVAALVSGRDLDRVERAIVALSGWWRSLCDVQVPSELLQTGYFDVCYGEDSLRRYGAELELVGRAFPQAAARVGLLQYKLDALDAESRARLAELRNAAASERWERLYKKSFE